MSHPLEKINPIDPIKVPVSPQVEREISRALRDLSFGSVEIVVHDGRVVQIERKEKVRFS